MDGAPTLKSVFIELLKHKLDLFKSSVVNITLGILFFAPYGYHPFLKSDERCFLISIFHRSESNQS